MTDIFGVERNYTKFTHDGFYVTDDYKLTLCVETEKVDAFSELSFSVSLEFNVDGKRRRPYLSVFIGGLHIQAGWLWEYTGAIDV